MVCTALHTARCQLQHIVAGEIFHWSREERRFQRELFSRAWFTPVSHRTRKQRQRRSGAYAEREQRALIVLSLAASARARRCAQRTERNGGFGFQTKVKDRFLNQRRWTCWYSCRENMQVLSATDSLVFVFWNFSFCFRFEKLVIFAVYLTLHYGGFPYFFILLFIWFLSVC